MQQTPKTNWDYLRDLLREVWNLTYRSGLWYWRWAISRSAWWSKGLALGIPAVIVFGIGTSIFGGGGSKPTEGLSASSSPNPPASQLEVSAPLPSATRAPTESPTPKPPTATRVPPTETPLPPTATPLPEPVVLSGRGQTATRAVSPPGTISIATFTHSGRGNFIVHAFIGSDEEYLVNSIGAYKGSRPLITDEGQKVIFDIDADGPWTLRLDPIGAASSPSFQGTGDAVSGLFTPPSTGAWSITHTGRSNFVVWLHCAGGSDLVQNEIGSVSGSRVVKFSKGPCFWEVEADGRWSLTPQ